MITLAIALSTAIRPVLDRKILDANVVECDMEVLVAEVCAAETGQPYEAGVDVKTMKVFTDPNQQIDFCLMAMISRSHPLFDTHLVIEECIRLTVATYFQDCSVSITTACQIVIIDRDQ